MKKKSFCTGLALVFLMMSAERMSAQVMIGSQDNPQSFSQLEIESGNKTGMRLPQISTTEQRDAMFTDAPGFKDNPLSKGLQIFNLETECVEIWNGVKWIVLCEDATGSGTTSATATNANNNPILTINTEIIPPIVTHNTSGATGIGTPSGLPAGVNVSWLNGEIIISGTPTESGTFPYTIPLIGGNGTETATGTIRVDAHTADTSGNYRLIGKMCYDVAVTDWAEGNICVPLASRNNDFTIFTFDYTFVNSATFSNLTFEVTGTDANVVDNVVTVSPNICRITFKSNIRTLGQGKDKSSALKFNIVAKYKDNTNAERLVTLDNISVQDCSCGCAVRSTLTAPPYNGWIVFQCHNLGADKSKTIAQQMAYVPNPNTNASPDSIVYGSLFQWGRIADGHQLRTSDLVSGAATSFDDNSQVKSTDSKYRKFINATVTPYDWHSPQNDNLWNFTTYPKNNPCDPGWRVPTTAEWQSIYSGSGNTWKWNSSGTQGYLVYPNSTGTGAPTLFLPAAGFRHTSDTGKLTNVGTAGYYWSSNVNSTRAYYLGFDQYGSVYLTAHEMRMNGNSVRCVAE